MDSNTLRSRMDKAISHFEKEILSVRTARASSTMLDNLMVEAYGTKTPINQLGNINVSDPNTLTIQVWDTSLLKYIENSIIKSNLSMLCFKNLPLAFNKCHHLKPKYCKPKSKVFISML